MKVSQVLMQLDISDLKEAALKEVQEVKQVYPLFNLENKVFFMRSVM